MRRKSFFQHNFWYWYILHPNFFRIYFCTKVDPFRVCTFSNDSFQWFITYYYHAQLIIPFFECILSLIPLCQTPLFSFPTLRHASSSSSDWPYSPKEHSRAQSLLFSSFLSFPNFQSAVFLQSTYSGSWWQFHLHPPSLNELEF